jgi:hypothetical protein
MNPFAEKYKTLSNYSLLEVISNPCDYQPLAIQAAEDELAARELPDVELEALKTEIRLKERQKQVKSAKKKDFENKVKGIGMSIVDTIHPIQQTTPSAKKIIITLCIVFGVLFLIEVFSQFGFLKFMVTYKEAKWSFSTLFYFLPILLVLIAIFPFWRQMKIGWIIFCIYLSYSVVNATVLLVMELRQGYSEPAIDRLFPSTSPVTLLWNMLFFGGCLWIICKKNIREIYNIDKLTICVYTGIGGIVFLISTFNIR